MIFAHSFLQSSKESVFMLFDITVQEISSLFSIIFDIDKEVLDKALDRLKVDKLGLDETDYNLLISIIEKFNGGPVGIDALAASIGEEASTIEDVYEPYLLQNGYLKRTSRGRMVTDKTYKYLGYEKDN